VVIVTCAVALFSAWLAMTFPPRPAAAMFLALVGGALVLFNPFLGVLAYYTLAFMRPQDVFWGFADTRLTLLVSISTLAATAFHFLRKPNLDFLKNAQCLFIGILWLFIYLSTVFGEFGGPEPKWLDYYNKMFLTTLIVLCLATSEKKLLVLCCVIGLSIAYLGYWANEMYFFQGWHIVHGPGKPGATYRDENDFAMVLVVSVPILWYLMRAAGNLILKAGLVGLLGLVVHAVMLTYSRGGFLGVAAAMIVIALREKNRMFGALLVVGGLASFILFTGEAYRARIGSINTYEEDESATGRFESWEAGKAMVRHNPLFGVGLKRYVKAFPSYSSSSPRVAHNSWVQLSAECGLIAVGAYGILVILTIRSLFRVEKRVKFLTGDRQRLTQQLVRIFEAALAGYLICGFFLSVEDFEFFYVLVAMVQVLDRITEQRVRENALSPAALAAR
jgi:probable O-glycosylation ligase (exosortase A-associated)